MTDENSSNQLTPAQSKLFDCSVAIFGESATSKEAAFMARQLVQVTLPHRNPGNVPEWVRRNGNLTLSIKPGYKSDPKNKNSRVCIGYPYGIIPRLLLFWIITEAVRTKSRRLELGHSINKFMVEIGLNHETGGGKRGDARRLRDQMERFFNAFIGFEGDITRGARTADARINMVIASQVVLWWNPAAPDQPTWGSWIELSQEFYDAITAAPVPVDMRALRALKKSPLALDLYAWLVYEAFRSHKSGESRFETWEQLHAHMGGEYAELRNFRLKANAAVKKIMLVYPGLRLGDRQGGIEVLPESLPALQPRNMTIEGTATEIPTATPPVHRPQRPLKPSTIERFRASWRWLDPYACQADFEAWINDKPTERQPKHYDAAFMGFAEKWCMNKR